MKKYVVNKDGEKRELTDEQIRQYRNFAEVKEKYQRLTHRPKPLYKDPKAFLGLLFIVILIYILFSEEEQARQPADQDQTEQTQE